MSIRRIGLLLAIVLVLIGAALFFLRSDESSSYQSPIHVNYGVSNLEQTLMKALSAYNSGNQSEFLALFASTARPVPNAEMFRNLFIGYYRDEYGKYKNGHVLTNESSMDPQYGQVVYEADFQKHKKVKVSANFVPENGTTKLAQIRFEKTQ